MTRIKPDDNTPENPRADHPVEHAAREFEREGRFEAPQEDNPTLRPNEPPHLPATQPSPPSPEQIREQVELRVGEVVGVDFNSIRVSVEEAGVAVLQGNVSDSSASSAAEKAAASVRGVRSVRNELKTIASRGS